MTLSYYIIPAVFIILIVFFFSIRKRNQMIINRKTSKVRKATRDDFLAWLKPRLEKKLHKQVFNTKEDLRIYVNKRLKRRWRLEFVFNKGAFLGDINFSSIKKEIVNFLIKEKKVTIKK